MGKNDDDRNLPANSGGTVESSEHNERTGYFTGCGKRISGFLGIKCLLVLIVSLAVVLSALFWLPPFRNGSDQNDSDLDPFKGHEIVASFIVKQPVAFMNENVVQLEKDIFYEMSYASIEVIILATEPSTEPNTTKVVFGIDPDTKYSEISPLSLSFIRESFESLVTNQSSLELTESLFGQPFLFEVLKFPGGITVIPPQSAFPLQTAQILFNFTINFSIYQTQMNFIALTSQLREGLHLAPFENLHLSLSNSKGSTVSPPTTVQSLVVLRVGNTPIPRLKQLAQTIKGSSSRNLGLNNTVFGKVKQVRLSSISQHSPNGDDAGSPSPSPSPLPLTRIHHHHHHHHNHHKAHLAPVISPVQSPERNPDAPHQNAPPPTGFLPAPRKSLLPPKRSPFAEPPCNHGMKQRPRERNREKHSYLSPKVAPDRPPHHVVLSPQHQPNQPEPSPARKAPSVSVSAPLPHVVFAHAQPPPRSEPEKRNPTETPPSSHSPDTCSQTLPWATFLISVVAMMFDV